MADALSHLIFNERQNPHDPSQTKPTLLTNIEASDTISSPLDSDPLDQYHSLACDNVDHIKAPVL